MDTEKLLEERGKTHGKWTEHSQCSTELKHLCSRHLRNRSMDFSQSEGLSMILHKIARILCGNPNEPDHWRDIAGYATLVAKELEANGVVEGSPQAAGKRPYVRRNSKAAG
jgi:hypothetical protein